MTSRAYQSIANDLIREEGYEPYLYEDHLGYKTIGIGFMIDPDHPSGGTPMPMSVAKLWLTMLIEARDASLTSALPFYRDLSIPRQDALINMAFQLGVNGLLKFKNMLRCLEAGDYEGAAKEALDSRWAKQTPQRAARVALQLEQG